jgi:nitroreductase
MDVSEAVASRRSIRAFLDAPVDRATIETILDKARFAPSGGNLQPWHVVVMTGAPLRRLSDAIGADIAAGVLGQDEYAVYPPGLVEPYRSRRVAVGEAMHASVGIAREDKPARLAQVARNFTAFGAPVCLFVHTPRFMGPPQWADMGMWLQTVMLLLREAGLDSCAQESWARRADHVRAHVAVPDDHIFFCGLAIGHRNPDAPINLFPMTRAPLDESVRWSGFE